MTASYQREPGRIVNGKRERLQGAEAEHVCKWVSLNPWSSKKLLPALRSGRFSPSILAATIFGTSEKGVGEGSSVHGLEPTRPLRARP